MAAWYPTLLVCNHSMSASRPTSPAFVVIIIGVLCLLVGFQFGLQLGRATQPVTALPADRNYRTVNKRTDDPPRERDTIAREANADLGK